MKYREIKRLARWLAVPAELETGFERIEMLRIMLLNRRLPPIPPGASSHIYDPPITYGLRCMLEEIQIVLVARYRFGFSFDPAFRPRPWINLARPISLFLNEEECEGMLGDVKETYARRYRQSGSWGANKWFCRQAVLSIFPLLSRLVRRVIRLLI